MKNGTCSKHFPKSFQHETTIDSNRFVVYRRAHDDHYIIKNGCKLDNRWIVPYNMTLLKKYQAHINVEWRNKTKVLNYLFKYITKGLDQTKMFFIYN